MATKKNMIYLLLAFFPLLCYTWVPSLSESHLTMEERWALSQLRKDAERIYPDLRKNLLDAEFPVENLFKRYAVLFQRPYMQDVTEYGRRQNIFLQSLIRQSMLNKEEEKHDVKTVFGINKFSDWSEEEFQGLLKSHNLPKDDQTFFKSAKIHSFQGETFKQNGDCTYRLVEPPKAIDWRQKKKITSVKNQKKCGSCWAFVATEQTETFWAISGHPLEDLSVQEFISCAPSLGCNGGNTCQALAWLISAVFNQTHYRLVSNSEYPYEAKETACKYRKTSMTGVTISGVCGCRNLVGHEHTMVQVLAQRGPLGVNVNSVLWHDYVGGIIQRHCTNQTINHAVQIVGYDLSDPVPHYIVRNTWGPDFGEDGYLRIKYGENLCGLAEEPSFVYI